MTRDAASLIDESLSSDVDIDEALENLATLEEEAGWVSTHFREPDEERSEDSDFPGGFKRPEELVE